MSDELEFDDPEPQRGFTGFFIPVEVLNDPGLRPTDKLLLAEIDALSKNSENACRATNEHLAHRVGLSAGGIANAISRLRRAGYIEDVRFDGRRRWIRAHLMKAAFTKRLRQHSPNGEVSIHQTVKKDNSLDYRESKKEITKERFRKPTVAELAAYAQSIGFTAFIPARFLDHYEANGWRVGKTSMVDWKAAVRTWRHRNQERNNETHQKTGPRVNLNAGNLNEGLADQYKDIGRSKK